SAGPNCSTTGPSSVPRDPGRARGRPVNLSGLWMCDASADRQPGRYQYPSQAGRFRMLTAEQMEPAGHVHVNTGRLWGGGIATAIVAALAVMAGVFITRGVLGIPVLAPKAASDFGDSSTAVYAGLAAGCALLATALLHVLLLGTPRPFTFFAWITGLADVVAAAAPFTQPAPLASKIFTAIINIVVGVAVISLLSGVGRVAIRPAALPTIPDRPVTSR
ncbi:MAG TPA: DUF6069 family protein, partial [Streptosporangiaceae bacterium]